MAGANLSVRKSMFLKAGGFDTSLKSYEDIEFSQRIKKTGQTAIDPGLRVETSGRRFRHGLLHGIRPWAINEVIRILEVEKKFVSQSDVRTEKSLWSRIFSIIPAFSIFALLFFLFYFSEPSISQAKQIKTIAKNATLLMSEIQDRQKDVSMYISNIKNKSKEMLKAAAKPRQ